MEQDLALECVFKIRKVNTSNTNARVAWSSKHDEKLIVLVDKYKEKKWKKIAEEMQHHFNDRDLTAKKCREHWYNFTDPKLNKTSLTEAEELFILIYHRKYKNRWAVISQYLPSRNNNKIKNNFSSLIKRICRKISLNIVEEITSMLEYIKFLYSISFISKLLTMSRNPEEITTITSIYLYEYVMEKKLTTIQCFQYSSAITKAYLDTQATRLKLQKLFTIQPNQAEEFLVKVFDAIEKSFKPSSSFVDNDLIEVVESTLTENDLLLTTNMSPIAPIIIRTPSPYYPPFKQVGGKYFEPDVYQVHEPYYFPIENKSDLHLPTFTFASPAFQDTLQYLAPGFSSPLQFQNFSPRYGIRNFSTLPASTAGSIGGRSFAMPIFAQSTTKETEGNYMPSEINLFTDKYLQ